MLDGRMCLCCGVAISEKSRPDRKYCSTTCCNTDWKRRKRKAVGVKPQKNPAKKRPCNQVPELREIQGLARLESEYEKWGPIHEEIESALKVKQRQRTIAEAEKT